MRPTILIADDHQLFAVSLRSLLSPFSTTSLALPPTGVNSPSWQCDLNQT